jgi:hypothetical protein
MPVPLWRVRCLLLVRGLSFMRCLVLVIEREKKDSKGLIRPRDHAILGTDFIPRSCDAETTERSL